MNTKRSAFREPMVWLMLGLPAASVFAGLGLVAAAVLSGGADEVSDQVQRTGQIQVTELGPDARALSMKLSAVLHLDDSALEILPVNGEFVRGKALVLKLSHPTDAGQDRQLTLPPTSTGWRLIGNFNSDHDWIARLGPVDGRWRVQGRVKAGMHAVYLRPALVAD